MGLDMYLTAEKYLPTYKPEGKKQSETIKAIVEASYPVESVKVRLAYWRKANQIHNWFVENVQNGVDECQTVYVSKEKLEELLKVVNEVLENHSKAEKLLPTTSGFFFGSTEYNKDYFSDLKETKEQLEKILASDLGDWSIEYHSSW